MARDTNKEPKPAARPAERTSPQPKFIVPDANVFVADYWLRSPSFVLLRDFLKKTNALLVVPKIVLEEVINHHSEELRREYSDIRKVLREAGRLIRNLKGHPDLTNAIFKKSRQDPYEKFLSSELASLNAKILDYSSIPQADVVGRDLKRRKPFQESGKGYRDTLIWETIVRNCIEKDTVTVFITQNIRDFYDSAGDLHNDLRSDVIARTSDEGSLVLCRDLPTFTDSYVVPFLTKRKDFAVLVQHNKVPGINLESVCEQHVDTLIEALDNEPAVMTDDTSYEPSVDDIELPRDFEVVEASELSERLLLVVFRFHSAVHFAYFLPRSDYFAMTEEELRSIVVADPDWNEHVMQVETWISAMFSCRLTFNSEAREVESFEVEGVERVDENS